MRTKRQLLGQHFLKPSCRWVTDKLIDTAKAEQRDTVLEIGAGNGILTIALSKRVKKVITVEKDKVLFQKLTQKLEKEGINNVELVQGNILRLLESSEKLGLKSRYKVIANIPYSITSRLLRLLFVCDPKPDSICITVQKEVAQRICAKPPNMNLLAIMVGLYAKPKIVAFVPRSCFLPPPKVESAIIYINNIANPNRDRIEKIMRIAKIILHTPRKTILNNLSREIDKYEALNLLEKLHISHKKRGQELSLQEFIRIAAFFEKYHPIHNRNKTDIVV